MSTHVQYTVQLKFTVASFAPTETDWYEWRSHALITFATRLQSEIENDATLSVYSPSVLVMYDDSTDRFNAGDYLAASGALIIIHSLREIIEEEDAGSARYRVILGADITAFVRRGQGLDSNKMEVGLVGDGTATAPGILEVMEDLRALIRTNYLESGGVRYLWDMRIGEINRDETFEDLGPDIFKYTMTVEGYKDDNLV